MFAFTYTGKQYTYTRIPQGFKYSQHIFNQILKADLEAKKASGCQVAVLASVVLIEPQPKLDDTIRIQQQASPYEQSMWHQRGAKQDSQEIWRAHEGQIVAPTSLLNILIADAHGFEYTFCVRSGVRLFQDRICAYAKVINEDPVE